MKKNIKVKDFVEGYRNCENATKYLNENLKIENYVPYATKMDEASRIVAATSYTAVKKMDEDGNETVVPGRVKISSAMRYALTIHKVIELYTNIETDITNFLDEYDMLKESGLIYLLIGDKEEFGWISRSEIDEFMAIVNMAFDDLMTNEYEIHSYVSSQVERITDVAKIILKPIAEKINNMTDKDIDKFIKNLEKAANKITK